MNIVFFGSSKFAVPSLKALIEKGKNISCVVTQPDREKGRGLQLEGTAIKNVAQEYRLKIFQPQTINSTDTVRFIKDLNPDLFVVIAYGQILSRGILEIPKIFAINAHASILPKYRGAAPINWALINGDTITGISIIKMTDKMDAGPIITQKTIETKDDDTTITLEDKLSRMAADLIFDTIKSLKNNDYKLLPQDESKVSFAPKLKKEDGKIFWEKSAKDIYNLIRGCLAWPVAFTYYKGKLLKMYKASVRKFASSQDHLLPGEIIEVSKEGIVVATGDGGLKIEELQIEGKRRMRVEEFIAGHKICVGEILGKSRPLQGVA